MTKRNPAMMHGNRPNPVKDETIVVVITGLGQDCGSFVWPTSDLERFRIMNAERACPNYFCWNEKNDMTRDVSAPKPGQLP